MHQIIYNIYIGDYHYETCIDEEGLAYLMHEAKEKAKGRAVSRKRESTYGSCK